MDTGRNIRELRLEAGYTQKQLAGIIGVKAAYVSALERGQRRPGKKILPLLCDALAVDEMTILFGPREVQSRRDSQEKAALLAAIERLTSYQLAQANRFIKELLASGERNGYYGPFILREPRKNALRKRPAT